MRKPFYWEARGAWYFRQRDITGKLRTIKLAADQDEAVRLWQSLFNATTANAADRIRSIQLDATQAKPAGRAIEAAPSPATTPAKKAKRATAKPTIPQDAKRIAERFGESRATEARLVQVSRILMLCDLLAPLRRGANVSDLTRDVSEMMGQAYCQRTIKRDLQLLETLGVVTIARPSMNATVAKWNAESHRASTLQATAAVVASRWDD